MSEWSVDKMKKKKEMLMEGRNCYSFISHDENGLKMLTLLHGGWCKWNFRIVWNWLRVEEAIGKFFGSQNYLHHFFITH